MKLVATVTTTSHIYRQRGSECIHQYALPDGTDPTAYITSWLLLSGDQQFNIKYLPLRMVVATGWPVQ